MPLPRTEIRMMTNKQLVDALIDVSFSHSRQGICDVIRERMTAQRIGSFFDWANSNPEEEDQHDDDQIIMPNNNGLEDEEMQSMSPSKMHSEFKEYLGNNAEGFAIGTNTIAFKEESKILLLICNQSSRGTEFPISVPGIQFLLKMMNDGRANKAFVALRAFDLIEFVSIKKVISDLEGVTPRQGSNGKPPYYWYSKSHKLPF